MTGRHSVKDREIFRHTDNGNRQNDCEVDKTFREDTSRYVERGRRSGREKIHKQKERLTTGRLAETESKSNNASRKVTDGICMRWVRRVCDRKEDDKAKSV